MLAFIGACSYVAPAGGVDSNVVDRVLTELVSSALVPGVVLHADAGRVYIMRPGGGIESVDTATGTVRWISEHADQPLFVADDVVLARVASTTPGLRIAFLAANDGEPAKEPQTLPLPEGVAAGIDDSLNRSLRLSVVTVDGEIYLTWDYIERDVTGVSPPRGRAFLRRESGAFRYVDGVFEASGELPMAPIADDWPAELQALVEARRVRGAPWKTAAVLAVAQQLYEPDRLVLKRWRRNDGRTLDERTLFEGRALAVLASCDERHIVVAVPGGRPAPDTPYVLRYFALDSGEPIAEVNSMRSAQPFCVAGPLLLTVSPPATRREDDELIKRPLELVAHDLASGAEVWRRAFRDTAFRGAPPPRH